MNEATFDKLVSRLEIYAKRNPNLYKFRVGALALLGYFYIFSIIAGLVATIITLMYLCFSGWRISSGMAKVIAFLCIPLFLILKSLWVRFFPPQGIHLQRTDAPQLFSLIDDLSKQLKTPKFHHILLTHEFNAGVMQLPRLGLLGWHVNYLTLGLPLMQSLSPEQFQAVVAHELGHLSGKHSRFSGWIYRVRQTWSQMLERLQAKHQTVMLDILNYFFNWYSPFFSAYSFVLARTNEYEADRCAMQLVGEQNLANALANVAIKGDYLSNIFWPDLYEQSQTCPEPPHSPFTSLSIALQENIGSDQAQAMVATALAEKTDNTDTHPCLSDRLAALKIIPENLHIQTQLLSTAADYYLGDELPSYIAQLDQAWLTAVTFEWKENYKQYSVTQQKLEALGEKVKTTGLTIDEAWEQARCTLDLDGPEAALPLLKAIVERHPHHAAANYYLGQILLSQADEAGIEHLEVAMEYLPDAVLSGCQAIFTFLTDAGQHAEAEAYQQRAEEHYRLLRLSEQERSTVDSVNRFAPHELTTVELEELQLQLAQFSKLKEAFLVRKVLNYFPEKPLYVLLVDRKGSYWSLEVEDQDQKLINAVLENLKFKEECLIVAVTQDNQSLVRKLRTIEGSSIYLRANNKQSYAEMC